MKTENLVDQLRDMVELSIESNRYPTMYVDGFIGHEVETTGDERELFTTIADRIEKEYMPLPRFEDGEPVKIGDIIDGYELHGAKVEAITDWGGVIVRSTIKGGSGYPEDAYPLLMWDIKDCKRHMPEVLDADGVQINVGDVVYFVDNAEAFDVLGVESDGDEQVHIGRKDGTSTDAWVSPGDLTHNQPDTLERIEEDARKMFNDYWGCGYAECYRCPATVDGKKPYERYECNENCTISQKLDLLRRQREVLERGQE